MRNAAHHMEEDVIDGLLRFCLRRLRDIFALGLVLLALFFVISLASWSIADPSLNHATSAPIHNYGGMLGAIIADLALQGFGLASLAFILPLACLGLYVLRKTHLGQGLSRFFAWLLGGIAIAALFAYLPTTSNWPLKTGLGGMVGDFLLKIQVFAFGDGFLIKLLFALFYAVFGILALDFLLKTKPAPPIKANHDDEFGLTPDIEHKTRPAHANASRKTASQKHQSHLNHESADDHADENIYDEKIEIPFLMVSLLIHGLIALRNGLVAILSWLWAVMTFLLKFWRRPRKNALSAASVKGQNLAQNQASHGRIEPRMFGQAPFLSLHEQENDTSLEDNTQAEQSAPAKGFALPAFLTRQNTNPNKQNFWQRSDFISARNIPKFEASDDAPPQNPSSHFDELDTQDDHSQAFDENAHGAFDADHIDEANDVYHALPSQHKPLDKAGKKLANSCETYTLPTLKFLAEQKKTDKSATVSEKILYENARLLESILEDFGIKGEIVNVRPGPVVTLYELEPAPGIKSSRIIGLADDIARSMSAMAVRVAVVAGRNAIGIEMPNSQREIVYLRSLFANPQFMQNPQKLSIALGKSIGGEPVFVDLAKMPHLLVAGTTGSGKSVAINTMILSLLYRLTPEECKLIMIDPKMLELSIYEGIPHLLTPVVTDPKKAVTALKWAVGEMESRYKKMSALGVRNIDGYNQRMLSMMANNERATIKKQIGFDRHSGEIQYAQEDIPLEKLPYIVVIVDEMADLMMVAGKDIEIAIQRLAQMARAAGIHIIMATQRPSVDVITGTIKANFPTRISFQVTSKIDSRTILGEQGAEQLLGQGDMLYMAGGGRISRVHGPFVSDEEVERIVSYLKTQGAPNYLDNILIDESDEDSRETSKSGAKQNFEEGGDLYDQAVSIVLRDRKCSTSYIQRRLSVGYNKAASLVERMEKEGLVGQANHAGKREILVPEGAHFGGHDD